ncbi:TetR/AcrR family transcriptional regulator [Longispora albida]|uniref:TetR/AcrR family transcriptional regulator n=1 Tax=Longispora albida TaxID=203523 RepID=UPI00036436B9|nr:TetR family transcriptional regulator [Longispora albida]
MPRPATTDTRKRLLAAARAEFSEHGLAGARVDRIAAAAGCNKERIYANFGSKDGLYEVVFADCVTEIRAATPHDASDPGAYVGKIFDFHARHPHLIRMLVWEGLQCTPDTVPDAAERRAMYQERMETLAAALGIPPGPEASRLLFVLFGLAGWPHAMPVMGSLITNGESSTEEGRLALRDFIADFTRKALRQNTDTVSGNVSGL